MRPDGVPSLARAQGVQDPNGYAVSRTNDDLMAGRDAARPRAGGDRAVDIPLDQVESHAPAFSAIATSGSGLRVDLSFVGATGEGVPDTMGAVGPTQYLVVLNSVVRSFDKATGSADGVLDLSLTAFFAPSGAVNGFDPKVRFDRLSGRWFVVALSNVGSTSGGVLVAVSSGGVLTRSSSWTFFRFKEDGVPPAGDTGCRGDYTRMSVDAQAVYLVFGMYLQDFSAVCPGNATSSSLFVIRKSSLLGGGPLVVTAFRGSAFFKQPADQFDAGDGMGYVTVLSSTASVNREGGAFLRVIDPGGAPSLSPEVPYGSAPLNISWIAVRHKGNVLETGRPEDFSGRMSLGATNTHSIPIRRGHLWYAELVGVDNQGALAPTTPTVSLATRDGIRFIELANIGAAAATTIQTGILSERTLSNDVDQRNYWMPSVMVSGQGHMAIASSAAGTNEFINAAVAGRLATDPAGALRPAILYTTANAAYNGTFFPGFTSRRWGDYSNISLDPCDDMTMWAIQQFTAAPNVWGVGVGRIRAPGPPSAFSASPAVIPAGAASVDVTLTGTPTDGEGFYDPGAGFGCRLAATVDGGVVVNSLTYLTPTTIRLNLTTPSSSAGSRRVTITNPDGQSVSLNATFSVSPPNPDLDRRELHFGTIRSGAAFSPTTTTQRIRVLRTAPASVQWSVEAEVPWLHVTPASGIDFGFINVSVTPTVDLPPSGDVPASITVTSTSPPLVQTIRVVLHIYRPGQSSGPVGFLDTPVTGTTGVAGSIPVTGWSLDDVQVARVRILRDPVAPEPAGSLVFVGDATLLEGARPDVAAIYPAMPHNIRGGWGYLMLTNFLPTHGNGAFKLYAVADDLDGHSTVLGTTTITCDNAHSTAPFGAIDTPLQGEEISGVIPNFGWVLAPGVARADVPGGGLVTVFVDGQPIGVPTGWTSRVDLTTFFPAGFSSLNSTLALFGLDTRALTDGVHTIAWGVQATNGVGAGIGSRFFTVSNGAASTVRAGVRTRASALRTGGAVSGRRGFDLQTPLRSFRPGRDGVIVVHAEELDRIELHVGAIGAALRTGDALRPLPPGAALDPATGVFTWQPGVGFVGAYDFVFDARVVRVVLNPRASNRVGPQVAIDQVKNGRSLIVTVLPFVLSGWAADVDSEHGTGIDRVQAWAYPVIDGRRTSPIALGVAAYGSLRADVSAIYGQSFASSGYELRVSHLPPGTYDVAVFAHASASGEFLAPRIVRLRVR